VSAGSLGAVPYKREGFTVSDNPKPDSANQPLSVHRAELFVVGVQAQAEPRKVFQVQFSKGDGSIFVNFPYYRETNGLVSLVTWHPDQLPPADLSLEPGGKATSHLVKYSHHPDGGAHFSQDGKVYTTIKKNSVPLPEMGGHLFTMQIQGLTDFDLATPKEVAAPPSNRRIFLKFSFPSTPEAVKFVGFLYSESALRARLAGDGIIGPTMPLVTPTGKTYDAFVCSAPPGQPGEHRYLLVYAVSIPVLSKEHPTALTFIGGFDSPDVVNDLAKVTTFLALAYPASDPKGLAARIGTIDFRP